MALSRDSILKHAGTLNTKEVHVPAWADENGDDVVILRGMTIREFEIHQARISREQEANDGQAKGDSAARLLARVIVDENGARVFRDEDAAQIAELGLGEVMKLNVALNELSGLGDDDEKQAAVDKAAEGESEAQTSNSSSE